MPDYSPLSPSVAAQAGGPGPNLVHQLGYARRTETSYVHWIKRYILFHGKRHPREMGKSEVEAFLTNLTAKRSTICACALGSDKPCKCFCRTRPLVMTSSEPNRASLISCTAGSMASMSRRRARDRTLVSIRRVSAPGSFGLVVERRVPLEPRQ